MGRDKDSEFDRRKSDYSYEIGLLVGGMSCSNVFILSRLKGKGLSMRTIQRLKHEFVDRFHDVR